MSDGLIVTRVGQEPLVDIETFAGALQHEFPGDWRTWEREGAWPMLWSVDIYPPGQPGSLVSLGGDGPASAPPSSARSSPLRSRRSRAAPAG